MEQMNLFDMQGDPDKRSLLERAKAYFDENVPLLLAFKDAGRVMQRESGKVSARFLVEFARWLRFIGPEGMYELLSCFEGVVVRGEDVAAIPNAYSAYLTRVLEDEGISVTKARSVMDE